uniref:Uncharacterized protein n=1 Tax=Trypanosoma vivax (strain Y486) TaxID=1055687 RepID=G0U2Y5_TRYVY|nr:hypothetical protein, unlikely [Trypanosoma vivax Y486]
MQEVQGQEDMLKANLCEKKTLPEPSTQVYGRNQMDTGLIRHSDEYGECNKTLMGSIRTKICYFSCFPLLQTNPKIKTLIVHEKLLPPSQTPGSSTLFPYDHLKTDNQQAAQARLGTAVHSKGLQYTTIHLYFSFDIRVRPTYLPQLLPTTTT